jgi:hypothetical protein
MSVSPADSNRAAHARRQVDAETGQPKSVDAAHAVRRDAPRTREAGHDRHQGDFERALRRAGNEGDGGVPNDEATMASPAAPAQVPQPQRFEAPVVKPGNGASPRSDARVAPGLRTEATTLFRQMATPLVANGATQRLQIELADAGSALQRIDLERTHGGHVDLALTAGAHGHARSLLDASIARLRTRLAERGTALGRLHLEPPDAHDDGGGH